MHVSFCIWMGVQAGKEIRRLARWIKKWEISPALWISVSSRELQALVVKLLNKPLAIALTKREESTLTFFWQMLKFCQKSREPKATVSSNEITRIDPHTWSGRKWHGSDANGGRAGHSTCRRAFCANFNAFYAAEKIRALRRELGERIPISTSTKRPRQPAIPRSASPTRLEHRKCSGLGVAPAGEGISLDKLFPPSRFLLGGPVQRVVHSTTTVG